MKTLAIELRKEKRNRRNPRVAGCWHLGTA